MPCPSRRRRKLDSTNCKVVSCKVNRGCHQKDNTRLQLPSWTWWKHTLSHFTVSLFRPPDGHWCIDNNRKWTTGDNRWVMCVTTSILWTHSASLWIISPSSLLLAGHKRPTGWKIRDIKAVSSTQSSSLAALLCTFAHLRMTGCNMRRDERASPSALSAGWYERTNKNRNEKSGNRSCRTLSEL